MRDDQAAVERHQHRQEPAQPPRNPSRRCVQGQGRCRGNGMGAACGRHHPDRAQYLSLPARHGTLETQRRNLVVSVQPHPYSQNRRRRDSSALGDREHIPLLARCHVLRRRIENPEKSRCLRQIAQLRLQYPEVQSNRHDPTGSPRRCLRRPQINIRNDIQ